MFHKMKQFNRTKEVDEENKDIIVSDLFEIKFMSAITSPFCDNSYRHLFRKVFFLCPISF